MQSLGADTAGIWSFCDYKKSLAGSSPDENWDELEKSIVANLADEVKVGIRDNTVELIIDKKF